ncbi:sensor histidine kinase [Sulfuriferula plumbiphila]|nr:HAMP domain-containing sensor histidine kinase [Sulfuriferula plumbiphila]
MNEQAAKPMLRRFRLAAQLPDVHPNRWLGLMLLMLHFSAVFGNDAYWTRPFLLAHYGLFLLWQPLVGGNEKLDPRMAALIFAAAVLLVFWSWWVLALWLAVLIGLVGTNTASVESRRQRVVYLLALAYLLALLLAWVMPHVFSADQLHATMTVVVRYGLIPLPLAIVLIRPGARQLQQISVVDFFYGLMLFLMVLVLVLGSFAVVAVTHADYLMALAQTLFAMALLLVVLSWLWNPRAGFGGLSQLLSRYLLSVGLPFEQWIQHLARQAEYQGDPEAFIRAAVASLDDLPWLAGGSWATVKSGSSFGTHTAHVLSFTYHGLELNWYTQRPISPALQIHARLLSQLLGYFYQAKLREQQLQHNAYTQAIHETGARLTHDVKNLLQSMKALVAAAQNSGPEQADALQALMQRQLPQMTQRLQGTLDKLKVPQQTGDSLIAATLWWERVVQHYARDNIEFAMQAAAPGCALPQDLFDSVLDNLVGNALRKRQEDQSVSISVRLECAGQVTLSVCDSGEAASDAVAAHLFDAPVGSEHGLGIGLYQAARQAAQLGYTLRLASNRDGEVCFTLSSQPG